MFSSFYSYSLLISVGLRWIYVYDFSIWLSHANMLHLWIAPTKMNIYPILNIVNILQSHFYWRVTTVYDLPPLKAKKYLPNIWVFHRLNLVPNPAMSITCMLWKRGWLIGHLHTAVVRLIQLILLMAKEFFCEIVPGAVMTRHQIDSWFFGDPTLLKSFSWILKITRRDLSVQTKLDRDEVHSWFNLNQYFLPILCLSASL